MVGTSRRTYLQTHPWLTFQLDLKSASFQFWMDLGAVQSKIEHVARAMLPPATARRLHSLYLAKGVHSTTAIEGNTLSERQVRARISQQEKLPPSQEYQGTEVDNIVAACNQIGGEVLRGQEQRLTTDRIKQFNAKALEGLPLEEEVVPGEVRQHSVGVRGAGYRGAPSKDCEYLLDKMCRWLPDLQAPGSEFTIGLAVIQAVMAHLYIAWIHPFGDGNGRTARLVEFQILLAAGVPSIAAHLLSNHYNQTRTEYYRQLSRASGSGGDVMPFLEYAVQGLRDGLDEQIAVIRKQQRAVAWRDYVYGRFRTAKGDAANRRRQVALELGKAPKKLVPAAGLDQLTPELASLYAGKTRKTISRDVNALVELGLIVKSGRSVRARTEVLLSLLPKRRTTS